MIPRTKAQPERERLDAVPLLETLRFADIVTAETDPRYRAMLRWATPQDTDVERRERLLSATLAKLWATPSH